MVLAGWRSANNGATLSSFIIGGEKKNPPYFFSHKEDEYLYFLTLSQRSDPKVKDDIRHSRVFWTQVHLLAISSEKWSVVQCAVKCNVVYCEVKWNSMQGRGVMFSVEQCAAKWKVLQRSAVQRSAVHRAVKLKTTVVVPSSIGHYVFNTAQF